MPERFTTSDDFWAFVSETVDLLHEAGEPRAGGELKEASQVYTIPPTEDLMRLAWTASRLSEAERLDAALRARLRRIAAAVG